MAMKNTKNFQMLAHGKQARLFVSPRNRRFHSSFTTITNRGTNFLLVQKKRVSQDNEAIDFWHALQIVPIPPFHYKLCAGDKKVERKRDLSNDEK